jgi:hypothetical protein
MNTPTICILLLFCSVTYLFIAVRIARTVKKKVSQQTIPVNEPVLSKPVIHKPYFVGHKRESLVLGNQRQRRKKFRQSQYLYNKYGV